METKVKIRAGSSALSIPYPVRRGFSGGLEAVAGKQTPRPLVSLEPKSRVSSLQQQGARPLSTLQGRSAPAWWPQVRQVLCQGAISCQLCSVSLHRALKALAIAHSIQ
jgi:hypothetical protein